MTKVPHAVEILPKISTAWVGCMSVTDRRQRDTQTHRRQTDGRATAYSEREREFTFAKNWVYNYFSDHRLFDDITSCHSIPFKIWFDFEILHCCELKSAILHWFDPSTSATHCDERVCMSVWPLAYLKTAKSKLHEIFSKLTCYPWRRSSVLLWRPCNKLCTSGFVNDVMFDHYELYGTWLRGHAAKVAH